MLGFGFGKGNGRGRGRGFSRSLGRGQGFGRNFGAGRGQGLGLGRGFGLGRILGFCRFRNLNNQILTTEEKELLKARLKEELAILEDRKKLVEEQLKRLE